VFLTDANANGFPERLLGSVEETGYVSAGFWIWPAYFLFFLMLAFPMVLTLLYVKAFLFALLVVFIAVRGVMRSYLYLHLKIVLWTLGLAYVSFFFCLRGMFLSRPGAVQCLQVYVIWPLVYLILLGGIDRVDILKGLERTLIFSTVFIALFGVIYSLSALGILPEIPNLVGLFSPDDVGFGAFDGYTRLAFPGLNSFPFLVPFFMAAALMRWSQRGEKWGSKLWMSTALLLILAVVLISGRRALQVTTMFAPFLTLILVSFQPAGQRLILKKSLRRVAVVFLLGIVIAAPVLSLVYSIDLPGVVARFSSGFAFNPTSVDDSPDVRRQQYFALMRGWHEHPLIGAGLGASAYGSIRSETMPWAYELYYLDLLFQTGIFGFLAYTAGIAWIYWTAIKIIRLGTSDCQLLIPVLVGMSGLLIATGTNPYLARFDGIWVIFLPLGFINHWLVRQDDASGGGQKVPE
jgi:O-antigen ligase